MNRLFAVALLFITACGSWNKPKEDVEIGQIWVLDSDPFMHVKVLAMKGDKIRIKGIEDERVSTISESNLNFFYHNEE